MTVNKSQFEATVVILDAEVRVAVELEGAKPAPSPRFLKGAAPATAFWSRLSREPSVTNYASLRFCSALFKRNFLMPSRIPVPFRYGDGRPGILFCRVVSGPRGAGAERSSRSFLLVAEQQHLPRQINSATMRGLNRAQTVLRQCTHHGVVLRSRYDPNAQSISSHRLTNNLSQAQRRDQSSRRSPELPCPTTASSANPSPADRPPSRPRPVKMLLPDRRAGRQEEQGQEG